MSSYLILIELCDKYFVILLQKYDISKYAILPDIGGQDGFSQVFD